MAIVAGRESSADEGRETQAGAVGGRAFHVRGAFLALAMLAGLLVPAWDSPAAESSADPDEPDVIEEIVVVAPRPTCKRGWICIAGDALKFPVLLPVLPGLYYNYIGGGVGGAPDEDDDEDDEEEEDFCWENLTAIPGARVSGKFGEPRDKGPHRGLDLAVPTGTAVFAARSGVVLEARSKERPVPPDDDESEEANEIRKNATSTGNFVKIKYEDGDVGRYLHLKQGAVEVKRGQKMSAGSYIAQSNATGRGITGPHLHYDHAVGDNRVDPQKELDDCP